ncbi:MAG: hypothetical protein DME50_13115 [Verrucomicrobia bacterium]|nr:MAG: hypothetical protein DME85_08490 [Verrucomicrobiota bacterium]PYK64523.1 MAG: hypothetical protein DME50_13115 [Verrucomicrobiota bacterium]
MNTNQPKLAAMGKRLLGKAKLPQNTHQDGPQTHKTLIRKGFKALPASLGHSDHRLEQVWRDSSHAVYKHFGAFGQYIGWEAIKIKREPARRIFGKDYPEREVYPGAAAFGRSALSVGAQHDLGHAIEQAKRL